MGNEKKKFNIFNIMYRDGKGVEKGTELKVLEKPGIANFFKLLGRRFSVITSVNLLYVFGNFPLFFLIFALSGYTSHSTVAPGTGVYSALKGSLYFAEGGSAALNSPVVASLNGIFGKQAIVSAPTALTWVLIGVSALFLFTSGPVNVGCTYILRNLVRGEPLFIWKDFWYAIKRNVKQGIIYGAVDTVICLLMAYNLLWFRVNSGASSMMSFMYFLTFAMICLYFFMRMYIYPMLITFDLSIFKMFKNALLFSILGIKRNLMCLVGVALVLVINVAVYFAVMPLGIILPIVITIGLCRYISVYCAFPIIKKYMIDPYYREIKEKKIESES